VKGVAVTERELVADIDALALEFELHRPRLRAVAYRMLGSFAEADDVLQESWLRFSAAGTGGVENVGSWLTTIVARLCLNALRTRRQRREEPLEVYMPDPVVSTPGATDPEHEVLLADAVGVALDVILDTLRPAERLALVLHDMFDVPFEDIAAMLGRSPAATRQLASRARRQVRDSAPAADPDPGRGREVVDAFFAAARGGDMQSLIALLDPGVLLRADGGTERPAASAVVRGASAVAGRATMFARPDARVLPVLVNGGPGVVVLAGGECISVMAFTVADGRIVRVDSLVDPERLRRLDLPGLG
jgi:RNA polymerase sigma-70 factor, ECF subfamily